MGNTLKNTACEAGKLESLMRTGQACITYLEKYHMEADVSLYIKNNEIVILMPSERIQKRQRGRAAAKEILTALGIIGLMVWFIIGACIIAALTSGMGA